MRHIFFGHRPLRVFVAGVAMAATGSFVLATQAEAQNIVFPTRPIYVIAHNLNRWDRVDDALDAGYNGIEVDATFNPYSFLTPGCGANKEWIACDPGNGASEDVTSDDLELKKIDKIFDHLRKAREDGKNLTVVWVDIKYDGDGHKAENIQALRGLVKEKLLSAGIPVLYEAPQPSFGCDRMPDLDGLRALTKDLDPLESVTVCGTYKNAQNVFGRAMLQELIRLGGFRDTSVTKEIMADPTGILSHKHRFVDDGSSFFAGPPDIPFLSLSPDAKVGDCFYSGSATYKGLEDSVGHRGGLHPDIKGVFAWTLDNSDRGITCAENMLYRVGVDGLIAGDRAKDYGKSSVTDDAVEKIKKMVENPPKNVPGQDLRMANICDDLFGSPPPPDPGTVDLRYPIDAQPPPKGPCKVR